MRISVLAATMSFVLCGAVHAEGVFIPLQTPDLYVGKISANGAYVQGLIPQTAGYRWTASTGAEEFLTELGDANGINNAGTIAGAVPLDGGSENGGRDLAAISPVGGSAVLLSGPLNPNSVGYDISDDGTVVGLSFDEGFTGAAVAFVWSAAAGMSALPVARPTEFSRANVISADGHVIAGWNDGPYGRSNVIWHDRVPMVLTEKDGYEVGEADAISSNGQFVAGSDYMDPQGEYGAWLWSAATGLRLIPGMAFAFGITNDGKTVVGNADFFSEPARAAMIWREGKGTMLLVDYLAEQGIAVPEGWDPALAGGFGGISSDGSLMGGWSFGPLGVQSYIIRMTASNDAIFANGFEAVPTAK